jgi:hypothetical protein
VQPMRALRSFILAASLMLPTTSIGAAPVAQSVIDPKILTITVGDLPQGYVLVPDRTISENRSDGVAIHDVTFVRDRSPENLSSDPLEVRSGVARTAKVEDAVLQLESTKEAFLGKGWTQTGVPALGDETLGLTQTTEGAGGQIAHYSYLFRKGPYISMASIRGRPDAVKVNDVVSLSIIVFERLDKALGIPALASSSTVWQVPGADDPRSPNWTGPLAARCGRIAFDEAYREAPIIVGAPPSAKDFGAIMEAVGFLCSEAAASDGERGIDCFERALSISRGSAQVIPGAGMTYDRAYQACINRR